MKKYFSGNQSLVLYTKATSLLTNLIKIDEESTTDDRTACAKYLAYVLQSFYDDGYYDGLETVTKHYK